MASTRSYNPVNVDTETESPGGLLSRLKTADLHLASWIGWVYKPFYAITGPGESIINSRTGEIRPEYARLFSRTWIHAVAGDLISTSFDDETRVFKAVWIPDESDRATEIRVMRRVHYKEGIEIAITPNQTGIRIVMDRAENENLVSVFGGSGEVRLSLRPRKK